MSVAEPVQAGAWPQPKGDTEIIVSITQALAHRTFDPAGNAVSQGRFKKVETQVYAEHGLTDRITLLGEVARSRDKREAFNRQFTDTEFRRVGVGARAYLFTWDETLYSVDALTVLNTSPGGDYPADTQSGDLDYELAVSTGAPIMLMGLPGFNTQRFAYRYRPGIRPSITSADITLGLNWGPDWMTLLKSNTEYSVGRPPSPRGHYWSTKAEFGVVHRLEPGFAIEAGAFRTFWGTNVLKETGLKLALWYDF
ncbi:hypothetical protein QMT40_002017 [Parvibaculaceae bacterium PLY_AMNH_Bact1]|nr:hypothetical protein QMT40_002017 [Parvibaculaceae bacterium PLY_AMNH_Bact1]